MPTIIRSGGFAVRILFPPREHGPPHVHVVKGGAKVIIRLGDTDGPVELVKVYEMKTRDVVRAVRLVETWKDYLLVKWKAAHGE